MYYSAFNIPEHDDRGTESTAEYFQVNCLGYYELENMGCERYRSNGRKDYLLIYNLKGKAVARTQGTDHNIGDGTVILYRPGEEQFYKLYEDQPVKSFWIHFTGHGAENILKKLNLADERIFKIGQSDEIPTLLSMARNEIQDRREGFELCASSLIIQVLAVISRKHLNLGFPGRIPRSSGKIDFSINYLHSNYQKNITVSELADLSSLSVSRYINIFKKLMGSTPKDYLIRFRLQKARELILDTNLTIRQISLIVGFDDQLYFSRVFKKFEGICPSEVRAKQLSCGLRKLDKEAQDK